MARGKKKESALTPEEKLAQVLVPVEDQPYKVPGNWCWTKIGAVLNLQAGKNISASNILSEKSEHAQYPCFGGNGVRGYVEHCSHSGEYPIIGRQGALCGNLNWASGDFYATEHAVVVTCPDGVCKKWAFHCLHYMDLNQYATSVAQPGLAVGTINQVPIALPPTSEQQRIVDRIEYLFVRLDEAKEKAQSVLDSFETRKAAILHKAFTGELTAKWRAEHSVDIASWKETVLQDVCEKIVCGKTPTGHITDQGEIPYLKVYNIVNNHIDFLSTPQFIPNSIHSSKLHSSILKPNDVIMNIVGPPLRKIAIIPDTYPEWNMNQAIVRFRPLADLQARFLYYALINPETLDDVIAATKGVVGQANISVSQSRNLVVNLPSVPEQQEIVRILDSLFSKEQQAKEAAEAVLEKIDLLKKSILARAFRGELGTNNPAEESAMELLKKTIY